MSKMGEEYNKRLETHAQDLYEACKELVGALTVALGKYPIVINASTVDKADRLARKAIAKVEGKNE